MTHKQESTFLIVMVLTPDEEHREDLWMTIQPGNHFIPLRFGARDYLSVMFGRTLEKFKDGSCIVEGVVPIRTSEEHIKLLKRGSHFALTDGIQYRASGVIARADAEGWDDEREIFVKNYMKQRGTYNGRDQSNAMSPMQNGKL